MYTISLWSIFPVIFQSPGQYFLRPMMKEYKFDPASQMIDVLEGTTVDISITGVRTAYRYMGKSFHNNLGLVARKPVCWVSEKARLKPAC